MKRFFINIGSKIYNAECFGAIMVMLFMFLAMGLAEFLCTVAGVPSVVPQ